MQKLVIAIDGLSACGKSTLARSLAKELNYLYVDSGAMYRATTLYAIQNKIEITELYNHLDSIDIRFENTESGQLVFLNGNDVSLDIRSKAVSDLVSPVAAISSVRSFLVSLQKKYGTEKGIVMDGRDIGTVVFPEAELKFFIVADENIRAIRRTSELAELGKTASHDEILKNLRERDHIDSTREDSPLKKAHDAIEINNSELNRKEQLELCMQYVESYKMFALK